MLIKAGAPVDVKNAAGETPLHFAAVENNEQIAELLVRSGADVLLENRDEKNALELSSPNLREKLLPLARAMDKGAKATSAGDAMDL